MLEIQGFVLVFLKLRPSLDGREKICWGALLFQYTFSNSAKLSHSLLFSFAIMLVKIEIETTETESHSPAGCAQY